MEEPFNALWPLPSKHRAPSPLASSAAAARFQAPEPQMVPHTTAPHHQVEPQVYFGSVGQRKEQVTGVFAASFNLTEELWIDNSSPANAKVLASAWCWHILAC